MRSGHEGKAPQDLVRGYLGAQKVIELADQLGISVVLANPAGQRALRDEHEYCLGFSPAPMWQGFVCGCHRLVVAPATGFCRPEALHPVSQLLHEVGHIACQSFVEENVALWEVYAALVLFGWDSLEVFDVIVYQNEAVAFTDQYQKEAKLRYAEEFPHKVQATEVRSA